MIFNISNYFKYNIFFYYINLYKKKELTYQNKNRNYENKKLKIILYDQLPNYYITAINHGKKDSTYQESREEILRFN